MTDTPPPAPGGAEDDSTAERLRGYAARATSEFQRAIDEHPALDRVPGRSVTLVGLGLVAAAIALSVLPKFYGVGTTWSIVMLAGAGVVALRELAAHGRPEADDRLPPALQHPLLPAAYAALVALHAFLLFRIAIVPLLFAVAAVLLGWDQYRRAKAAPDGFVHQFDVRRAWHGYRRNVTVGVGLCLAAMFMTWGQSSGYWSGGYSYNYSYRTDYAGSSGYAYDYDYNPAQYYWPGWELSGRNQSFALLAVALLLGLVLWASLRRRENAGAAAGGAGLVMGVGLAGFWLMAAKEGTGSLVFLLGLAMILFAAHRIWKGEETGRWDLETALAKLRDRGKPAVE